MQERICGRCRIIKPIKDFSVDKQRKDGIRFYCRECNSLLSKEQYIRNKEKKKIYSAKHHQENLLNSYWLIKRKARYTIMNMVRSGKIKRLPCRDCGEVKVQAHHEDYYKPLEIIWLCKHHHEMLHHPVN